MKRGLTVVLAALVLLTGCELRYRAISKLDITDAESLYLAPEAEARGTGNVMFKITKEGAVVEVSYTSDSGIKASAKSLKPDAIYHANDEYMIVVFRYNIACLVSKKTGEVYSLDNVGVPNDDDLSMFVNSSPVLSDGKNNIYFKTYSYNPDNPDKYVELYRIDVTNPAKVFSQPLTGPQDNQIDAFAVDAAGNVVYNYYGNNSGGARLALAGGGYKNLNRRSYWTAPDGNLYYLGDRVYDETAGEYGYAIYRLDIEGQKVTKTEYGNVDFYFNGYDGYYLESGGRAYILNDGGELLEVYNPEGKPRLVEGVPALTNIQAVTQSEDELFIAGESDGQPRVIRVNPVTGDWSDLYTPGDYEVYNMVYAGGRLTVNALRMNDGAIIMGELDGTGKMNVLDETSNSKVLYLTRIR